MTPTGSDDSGSEFWSNIEEIVKRIKWMTKEVDEKRSPLDSRDELVLYVREARDAVPLSTAGSLCKKWESAMTRYIDSSGR